MNSILSRIELLDNFVGEEHRQLFGYSVYDAINPESVKERYKELACKMHPDKGGSHDQFIKLTESKEALEYALRKGGNILIFKATITRDTFGQAEPVIKVVEQVINPLTGRPIVKHGALYKKLQRENKIPDDPQTDKQRRYQDRKAAEKAAALATAAAAEQHKPEQTHPRPPCPPISKAEQSKNEWWAGFTAETGVHRPAN